MRERPERIPKPNDNIFFPRNCYLSLMAPGGLPLRRVSSQRLRYANRLGLMLIYAVAVPRRELIVSRPMTFDRVHLLPILNDFLLAFPEINVRMALSDRDMNFVVANALDRRCADAEENMSASEE
jgi:DNA-binding transcriptional LysR family regulator